MRVDFNLPKRVPSIKTNPEVDFRFYGRHLEKSITSQPIVWLQRHWAGQCRMTRMTKI